MEHTSFTDRLVPAYHPTQINMLTAISTGIISDTALTSPIIDLSTPLPAWKVEIHKNLHNFDPKNQQGS